MGRGGETPGRTDYPSYDECNAHGDLVFAAAARERYRENHLEVRSEYYAN